VRGRCVRHACPPCGAPLARRDAADAGDTDRGAAQDLTLRLALDGEAERSGWTMALRASAIGVSRDDQRLRYGTSQEEAPLLDLADCTVESRRRGLAVTIGHQPAGSHRFLPNQFRRRGVGARAQVGSALSLGGALLHGRQLAGRTSSPSSICSLWGDGTPRPRGLARCEA
jgi:hypothetical protein